VIGRSAGGLSISEGECRHPSRRSEFRPIIGDNPSKLSDSLDAVAIWLTAFLFWAPSFTNSEHPVAMDCRLGECSSLRSRFRPGQSLWLLSQHAACACSLTCRQRDEACARRLTVVESRWLRTTSISSAQRSGILTAGTGGDIVVPSEAIALRLRVVLEAGAGHERNAEVTTKRLQQGGNAIESIRLRKEHPYGGDDMA